MHNFKKFILGLLWWDFIVPLKCYHENIYTFNVDNSYFIEEAHGNRAQ